MPYRRPITLTRNWVVIIRAAAPDLAAYRSFNSEQEERREKQGKKGTQGGGRRREREGEEREVEKMGRDAEMQPT
mgnify:CR=1 FL=1